MILKLHVMQDAHNIYKELRGRQSMIQILETFNILHGKAVQDHNKSRARPMSKLQVPLHL